MNSIGLCYSAQSRSDPVAGSPHRRKLPYIRSSYSFSGRRLKTAALVGAVALMSAITAEGEVYFNDSTVTVSISEGPASRNCIVRLKPTRTLGGDLAPRLTLATQGQSLLSFGVENPERYSNVVVVQNGARVPFARTDISVLTSSGTPGWPQPSNRNARFLSRRSRPVPEDMSAADTSASTLTRSL
jgi:hypothetical protein